MLLSRKLVPPGTNRSYKPRNPVTVQGGGTSELQLQMRHQMQQHQKQQREQNATGADVARSDSVQRAQVAHKLQQENSYAAGADFARSDSFQRAQVVHERQQEHSYIWEMNEELVVDENLDKERKDETIVVLKDREKNHEVKRIPDSDEKEPLVL